MALTDHNAVVLVTGAAGFIGYHLSSFLLKKGCRVIGIDSLNNYYDVSLKRARLAQLTIYQNFNFIKGNISDKDIVFHLFEQNHPDIVVNLAAQAGVRYSIDHPDSYIESNLIGFYNLLEACRHYPVKHLVFASSSSVYGNRKTAPFKETDFVDHPISLYAATKKSDELLAYSYCHLYRIPTSGLRFFTVYGPWGRPDMAYFKFADMIRKNEPIQIYNNGDMLRDFTYIDDIVEGILDVMDRQPDPNEEGDPYIIYNIGNSSPVKLMHMIEVLEKELGRTAVKEFLPMQPGDVYQTYADTSRLEHDFHFKPKTTIEEGLHCFALWYRDYYQI